MSTAVGVNVFRNAPINLKYTLQGPESGPVVVFVTGLGSQMVQMPYNTMIGPLIDRGFRVLRIENRDSGHSTILDQFEPQSIAKGITANLLNPATAKDSPLFFDLTQPVSNQTNPTLYQAGQLPQPGARVVGTVKNGSEPLQLGPDYHIYPGFQPREAVYQQIQNKRQAMLDELNKKKTAQQASNQQPKQPSGETAPTGTQTQPNTSIDSPTDPTATTPSPSHDHTALTPTDSNLTPQHNHDLYGTISTTTHRAPIAAIYEQYYYSREGNFVSRNYDSLYCLSEMAVDTILLINSLNIEQFHIFGNSMGGMIAMWVCALVPNRILSLSCVMSATGISAHNPKLWYLVRNLAFRSVPPTPPFPKIKSQKNGDATETTSAPSAQELTLQTSPSSPMVTGTATTTPSTPEKPSKIPDKKNKKELLKEYKNKLKEYNKNKKEFHDYVAFLVAANGVNGVPVIDPVTGAKKTYNNGRQVIDHVTTACRRAPNARGYKNQSAAIVASPCRDALLFFLAQHFPIFLAHGAADELVPPGNTQHSYDLARAALSYVAPIVAPAAETTQSTTIANEEEPNTVPSTTTTTTTITVGSEDQKDQDEQQSDNNKTETTPTKPTPIQPTLTHPQPVFESHYALDGDNAHISRMFGYNRNTKTYLQHRKLIVKGAKHEIVDNFTKYLVPQLILHLEQAQTGQSRSLDPILFEHVKQQQRVEDERIKAGLEQALADGSTIVPEEHEPIEQQPNFHYHDEDLLFGVEEDELEYYDPDAPPPVPPEGYGLVLKKQQYLVVELDKIKPGEDLSQILTSPVIAADHPEYITSPSNDAIVTNNAHPPTPIISHVDPQQNQCVGVVFDESTANGENVFSAESYSFVDEPSQREDYSTSKQMKRDGAKDAAPSTDNTPPTADTEVQSQQQSDDTPEQQQESEQHEQEQTGASGWLKKLKFKLWSGKKDKDDTTASTTVSDQHTSQDDPNQSVNLTDHPPHREPSLNNSTSRTSRGASQGPGVKNQASPSGHNRSQSESLTGDLDGAEQPQYGDGDPV